MEGVGLLVVVCCAIVSAWTKVTRPPTSTEFSIICNSGNRLGTSGEHNIYDDPTNKPTQRKTNTKKTKHTAGIFFEELGIRSSQEHSCRFVRLAGVCCIYGCRG